MNMPHKSALTCLGRFTPRPRWLRATAAAAALAGLAGCASLPASPGDDTVTVRVVGLNDFHGNLLPLPRPVAVTVSEGDIREVQAAGAAYLATAIAATRAQSPFSMVVAAGDLIGASPLASSLFLDEPTIGVMNRVGLDFNAVGNHEFDRGWRELLRIQRGGCEQTGIRVPCAVENPYGGADFAFLAANVLTEGGETLLPATGIKRFDTPQGEVAVGVIGLTLKDTPILVTPSGVDGLTFADEAATINALVPQLEAAGADAILVAIHQGLSTTAGYNDEGCGGISGPLLDIIQQVDPRVDVVLSGHTHNAYVCDYGQIDPSRPFLVTSAAYGGSMLTDIALEFRGDRLVAKTAENIIVGHDGDAEAGDFPRFAPDAEVAAYVERYVDAAREAAERPVGRLSGDAVKGAGLGRLIADAQLEATRGAGAQIALMNSGGIRAPLAPEDDGTITFGDIYAVQPFGNVLMTKSLTGTQLLEILEQQFAGPEIELLSPSAGFSFTYDPGRAAGQRILSATLNDQPIDPAANYRVTMNSFLASGGDGFATFAEGIEAVTGPLDLDAMEAWFALQPVTPVPAEKRAVVAGSQPR